MSAFAGIAAAYEGLERLDSFADADALERYRSAALERTREQADLVGRRLPPGGRVLEIGSGNGRLLIELAQRGALARGLGIELSASRTAFAQEWARAVGVDDRLELLTGDASELSLEEGAWDVATVITGTFAYFDAVAPGSAAALLAQLRRALQPGGTLVLELYPHPAERRLLNAAGGALQTWRELDRDDPWRFYLSALTLDEDVLTHAKTFVHRQTGAIDEGRSERLVLYTPETIRGALTAAGFGGITLLDGWGDAGYADGDRLVVLATRE